MTTRRSFLAAVAAALAIKPSQLLKARLPETLAAVPMAASEYRPFMVWEKITLEPGKRVAEQVLTGKVPFDFVLSNLGVYFLSDVFWGDVQEILRGSTLTVRSSGQDLLNVSPYTIWGTSRALPCPYVHRAGLDFSVELDSDEPLALSRPSTVEITVSGLLAMRGLQ